MIQALLFNGLGDALVVAGGFIAVNMVIGNILEPRVMGRGLGLSTLVVFLSLIFWGWLLGPVGMLLSVPLTIVARIALETTEGGYRLAVILGTAARRASLRRRRSEEDFSADAGLRGVLQRRCVLMQRVNRGGRAQRQLAAAQQLE